MPYKLKVTGITESRSLLEEIKKEIDSTINQLSKKSVSVTIGAIQLDASLDSKELDGFLKKLPKLLKKAHKRAINSLLDGLRDALNSAMEDPVWNWTDGMRDIIDTGKLKASLNLYADSDGDIHILYGQEYAGIVHYGGYINPYGNPNAKQYYPGRPWVDSVLNGGGPVAQYDFKSEYLTAFTIELQNLFG